MAGKLGERLDFILGYGVEGNQNLEQLKENLEGVKTEGSLSNEQLERSREILKKKLETEHRASQSTEQLVEKQMDLSKAAAQSNEMVRDVAIGLEILKTELQEGEISQEQYAQGIQELRDRLQNLDVITLSSARSQRMLSQEQMKAGQTMQRTQGPMKGSTVAMTSMFQILQDLPFGFIAISNNIPFFVQNLVHMNKRAGASGGVLKALVAGMTGPGGMALALTSLIPLIAVASQRYNLMEIALWDVEEAGTAAAEALKKIREELIEAEDLDNIEALKREMELLDAQLKAVRETGGDASFWERALLMVNRFTNTNQAGVAAAQALYGTVQTKQELINELEKERERIRARIIGLGFVEENQAANLQEMYADMLESTKRANEEFESMMKDFKIDLPEPEGETDRTADLAEQQRRTSQRYAEIGRARMQFEQQLQRQIFENQLHGLTLRRQLVLQEQRDIQQVRNNELISERQRQQMITEIQRNYSMQRADIVAQEEEMKRQEKQVTSDMAMDLLRSLDGLGEVVFGHSEKRAKQAFQFNKALALGTAIVEGARAVVSALPNIKRALIVGGMAAIQIAKIASTKFQGRGGGGGNQTPNITYAYRGFDTQEVEGTGRRDAVNIPDRLKLVDPSGKLLTEMEYDRDSRGDSAYLIDKQG